MSESAFSRRALYAIFGVAIASFLVGIVFAVKGKDPGSEVTNGANSYSRSAVGHRAFVQILRKLGTPVVVSQYGSGRRAAGDAVLVLVEPAVEMGRISLDKTLASAKRVLIVLPKWRWVPDPEDKRWIGAAALEQPDRIARVVDGLMPGALVVRAPPGQSTEWQTGSIGAVPSLTNTQYVVSPYLEPIVSTEHGTLLGRVDSDAGHILVLSDPDVLSNHGIGQGNNALIAVRAIELLRDGRGTVIVDETLHGYQTEPSIWRALFEFPLVLATMTAILAALALLWAATGRFGAPRPVPPGIEPGKAFLIDNTASLLQFGQHGPYILQRYLFTAIQDVAARLHAPSHLHGVELQGWLERVGASRGVTTQLSAVVSEISAVTSVSRPREQSIVLAANRLYSWKREILRGSTDHPTR